jgi:hypothetical protein
MKTTRNPTPLPLDDFEAFDTLCQGVECLYRLEQLLLRRLAKTMEEKVKHNQRKPAGDSSAVWKEQWRAMLSSAVPPAKPARK